MRLTSDRRPAFVAVLFLAGLVVPFAVHAADSPAISQEALRERITYLASNELAGRASGTRGNELAAQFIAAAFKKDGLRPIGTDREGDAKAALDGSGYYQPFTFTAGVAPGRRNMLECRIGGKPVRYRADTEFEPSAVSGSGRASGEVVFVGYGIQSQDPMRNDYAGADVQGKVVLFLAGAPTNDPHSPLQEFAGIRRKALTARDKGAAAAIVVLPKDSDVPHMSPDESASDEKIPVVIVRRSVARAWLESAGKKLDDVEAGLAIAPNAFPTGVHVTLQTDVEKIQKVTANIVGMLEGSDPAVRDQVLVIGAHMDHLGMGGPYSLAESRAPAIHHGADDNASGAAGVMALADWFSQQTRRPRRSILFLCFSGEELGLLGSAHYIRNPIIPLDRTEAMINMDMVGRLQNDKLIVLGSGTSPAWNAVLDSANGDAHFALSRSESGFGASDQQSFYAAKIPVLFFFTGLHADYHRPTDTADKINYEGEARVLRLVARVADEIASLPERPEYRQIAVPQENAPARFRVYFGSIPDYAAEADGVMLAGVREGSPAAQAGLKQGDIVVKFGDRSVRNIQDYTIALSEHKPGDVVPVVVKRGGQTLTLMATLAAGRR